jgi:hypothetical protein
MDLPIEIVPNTSPPRFRWKRTVSTLNGTSTVACEGTVPPQLECVLSDLIAAAKKLQAFKDWVHRYLDAQDVPPEFPGGKHTLEGCRIGDRMDWLMTHLPPAQGIAEVQSLSDRWQRAVGMSLEQAEELAASEKSPNPGTPAAGTSPVGLSSRGRRGR